MYYVFADSGEFICDYEKVEEALGRQSRMSEPTLVLYSTSPNCQDAWEHGIEVMAPEGSNKYFQYCIKYRNEKSEIAYWSGCLEINIESALEKLKDSLQHEIFDNTEILETWVEERITITHKVKL